MPGGFLFIGSQNRWSNKILTWKEISDGNIKIENTNVKAHVFFMFTYVWPSLLKTISNVSLTDCIACFFPLCFHMKGKNISAPKIPWTDLGHRNLDEIFTGGKSQKTFIFQGLSEVVLLMAAFLST